MLRGSWAQARTHSLALTRSLHSSRIAKHQVALALSRLSTLDVLHQHILPGFATTSFAKERTRGQSYSTNLSSVAEKALALLEENKIEEATSFLSKFPDDDGSNRLVMEVIEGILRSAQKDANILLSWLESFPDATNASSDLFSLIFDRLAKHPDNVELIQSFGVLCASKGYQDFVTVHISPFLARSATRTEYSDWKLQVQLAVATFKGLQVQPSLVLEEENGDYECVRRGTIPTPTILELVEETLPHILPAPIPQDMVFEEQSSEYATYIPSSSELSIPKPTASLALEGLINQAKFDDAYQLLLELETLGTAPVQAAVYQIASIAILKTLLSPTFELDEQTALELEKRYVAWLQLIPPVHLHQSDTHPHLKTLKQLLSQAGPPHIRLMSQTAVILASKGYTGKIMEAAVRPLYSDPTCNFDVQFTRKIETATQRYWEEHRPAQAQRMTSHFKSFLRSIAIRNLAASGRFADAISLIPRRKANGPTISDATYIALLRQLHLSGPAAVLKYEETVLKILGRSADDFKHGVPPSQNVEDRQPASYRWVERALKRGEAAPHPRIILPIIEECLTAGRNVELTLLLNKAMSAGYLHTSAFLHAEMLHYFRERQYDALLQTAEDHFHLGVGLPDRCTLELHQERISGDPERPQSVRFHQQGRMKLLRKMWPSSVHCNLVWHVLALETPNGEAFASLYQQLCTAIARGKKEALGLAPTPSSSYPSLTQTEGEPFNQLPNARAFVPFIEPLMFAYGHQMGAKVIEDIAKLGLEANVAIWTEYAHRLARAGESREALAVLDMLEDARRRSKEPVPLQRSPYGTMANRRTVELVPSVTTYSSLMRAFVNAQNVQGAEEVLRRFKQSGLPINRRDKRVLGELLENIGQLKSRRVGVRRAP